MQGEPQFPRPWGTDLIMLRPEENFKWWGHLYPAGQLPTGKALNPRAGAPGVHRPCNAGFVGQLLPFKPGGLPATPPLTHTHHTHSSFSPLMTIFKKAYKTYSVLKGMTQNCNWADSIISVDYWRTDIDNDRFIKSHSRYSLGNDLQLIKLTNDLFNIEEARQSDLRRSWISETKILKSRFVILLDSSICDKSLSSKKV